MFQHLILPQTVARKFKQHRIKVLEISLGSLMISVQKQLMKDLKLPF